MSVHLLRRLAAAFYDALIVFALLMLATAVLMPFTRAAIPTPQPLYRFYLLAIMFGYFAFFWTRGGQTVGMLAWHIRVLRIDGRPLNWATAALRFSAAILSWLALGLGFWWALFDRERRTWHDLWSGTRLVRITNRKRFEQ